MIATLLWCDPCQVERAPLAEDGTCGWCGKADWRERRGGRHVTPAGDPAPPPPRAESGHRDLERVRAVVADVASRFGLTIPDLTARTRAQPYVRVRQLAMHAARDAGASYPAIALVMERDHSTVITAVRAVAARGERLPTDPSPVVPIRSARVALRMKWGTWTPAVQSVTRSAT